MSIDLTAKLEKGFENWLKQLWTSNPYTPPIILNIDGSASQITMEEFVDVVKGNKIDVKVSIKNNPSVNQNDVSSCSEVNADSSGESKPKNIDIGENDSVFKVLNYRRLAPNESKPCEGESVGQPCALLATYEIVDADNPLTICYCETHFSTTRKSCSENGYRLEEL